ncbi:MAG: endonuclease/exonuclease/phosphatase family protein [Clostridia bacterium]|nr:endonuclease/exonuclease/phosphatase family protein [Clostridia bacterium]
MKNKVLKTVLVCVGVFLAVIVVFVAGFLIFESVTTLKVKDTETMEIAGNVLKKVNDSQEIRMLTWNIGYGGLDEKQDCYFDGGTGVDAESLEAVQTNINAIKSRIHEFDPDIFCLQEIDRHSKRSYHYDEFVSFQDDFKGDTYQNSFACNFKTGFVPVPLYNPTGNVEAGISTFSKFQIASSTRVQLPIPFSWPVSMVNLKRCLLITRSPVMHSDKELVIINLHLEAYDDGEGKAKQLKLLMGIMQEESEKGNYVVACGDFNQSFSNIDLSKYPKIDEWVCPVIDVSEYPDFTFCMDDRVPTCRSLSKTYYDSDKTSHQFYMLDGFIVSHNITIHSIETVDLGFKNTDHNPVMLSMNLE